MIVIDYQNRKPIYEQIVERFQMLIVRGVLEPDSQMPSVRSLATELSINPNTIQKAYTILEQQGYTDHVGVHPLEEVQKALAQACTQAVDVPGNQSHISPSSGSHFMGLPSLSSRGVRPPA